MQAGLAEDIVWTQDIRPVLGDLPDNVLRLWQHGFTEMFNNAIDHSGGHYVGDPLISRSQAKRVLARVDLFRTVVFDFSEVDSIGQAFADEIFSVFAQSHPEIELHFIHANATVRKMIVRARSHGPPAAVRSGKA